MSDTSYRLRSDEGTVEGVRRIARGRADKAARRLRRAEDGELAEAIHGARKDLKKLRALLRLVRPELGNKLFKRENARYREAGRLLSESRDAEVKLATLAALREPPDPRLPAAPADAWQRLLESDRDRVAGAAGGEAGPHLEEALALIEEGAGQIASWPLHEESWKLVEAGLTDGYGEGRDELAAVSAGPSDAGVHELRKRAKDLWYQLRIVAEAWPGPLDATVEEVHTLAELLGDHHDLAVLAADLQWRGGVLGFREGIADLVAERQEELLGRALALAARIYAEKPNAFRRRIRAYWRAWRGA